MNGLYGFKDDMSMIDEGMDTIIENNEYLSDFSKIISNIRLFHCNDYKCKETSGYIKYNSNNKIKVAKCEPKCDPKYKSNDCKTGNSFYSTSESKFNLCINNGQILFPKEITKDKVNLIFNNTITGKNSYNLYISDKSGSIIGLSTFGNCIILMI